MGMSVVDRIVKDYGGIIRVESEVDKGSTFSIYLPRVEPEEPPFEKTDERPPKGTGRILLLDDEEVQVFSIRSMLQQLGYEVEAFIDAPNALSRFRSDPGVFDLVITDQTMPRLTGIQVAQELLQIRGDIPIILCTGFSETVNADQARALGVREFLMKPYSIRKMAEVIQRAMTGTEKSSL
jgi:CheY-like chemotaxis protein